jgi:Fe(3+) dicitrate transport protein
MQRTRSDVPWVSAVATIVAVCAAARTATAADAPPPPAPIVSPTDAADLSRRAALAAQATPDEVVVRGTALRLDGPVSEVLSGASPLGLSGGPGVPFDVGGARDVLSPRRVREYTPVSVDEIANRLPGVSSRLYTGDEHLRPSLNMRGMPDNGFTEYEAVLVDGFNMSTLPYGWTAISIFPFTAERIWAAEVYRGAHAIRYGPTTLGGVINFVTPPIPTLPTVRERVVAGSHAYLSSTTEVGGFTSNRKFGAMLTYVDKSGDTFRDGAAFDVNELALKTLWNIDGNSWLAVNGAHWRDVHRLPSRLTRAELDADPTQNTNPDEVDWKGWAYWGTATYHRSYGACADNWFEAMAYHKLARRALESPRPANPPYNAVRSADSDNYASGLELRGEFSAFLGVEHRLHWGLRYHREEIQRTTFDEPLGGGPRTVTQDAETVNHAFAANLDDTVRIGCLTLQAGLRFEDVYDSHAEDKVTGGEKDFDFSDVFPGASATYELVPDRWAVFANVHSSFRAPQTFTYDFTNPAQELDFERGTNVEVGVRHRDPCRGLSGSVVLWQVDYSDFIELDPQTNVVTNYGGFETQGFDLVGEVDFGALTRRLCGLSLFANATYQTSEYQKGPFEGNDVQHVPDWIGAGGVRYEHPCGLYGVMDATYRGVAWAVPTNDDQTPAYTLWNARVGFRRTFCVGRGSLELDAAVACKNLFDNDYYLQHNATLYVPGVPREYFVDVSIGWEF